MSTQVPQHNENEEIDIFQFSKSIGNFFDRLNTTIFRTIQFFIRNWIIVLGLVIVGFGLGWYLDSNKKSFENQIIVTPNFGSVDYLYAKIDLIESKIIAGDTAFLKNVVGFPHPKELKKIQIESISDAFKLVEDKEQNFELLRLMAEDGDINKVLVDNVTSKNYTYHKISFVTNELTNEKDFNAPLLKYLNDSEYYASIQKIGFKNLEQLIAQNDTIIRQIDNVLKNFSSTAKKSSTNNQLVYYNENTQLNEMIKTKQYLVTEQGKNRLKLISHDQTIKEISSTLNLKSTKSVNGKLKLILPVLFVFLFVFLFMFRDFYKKQSQKNL